MKLLNTAKKITTAAALAPFPLSAFQRHGWRWRCSIRAGFGRLPEGSDSPPNGSEKQV